MVFSAVVPALAFFALAGSSSPALSIACFILIGSFGLSRSVLISNYMNKHIESHHRATVVSSVGMARQLLQLLTYPVIGLLEEWSLRGTFALLGAAILACAWASRVEEGHLLD